MLSRSKVPIFFERLVLPHKIKLEVRKLSKNIWEAEYTEWSDDKVALRNAYELLTTAFKHGNIEFKLGEDSITMTWRSSIEDIIAGLIPELLALSKIGDLTFREMLALMSVGLMTYTQSTQQASRSFEQVLAGESRQVQFPKEEVYPIQDLCAFTYGGKEYTVVKLPMTCEIAISNIDSDEEASELIKVLRCKLRDHDLSMVEITRHLIQEDVADYTIKILQTKLESLDKLFQALKELKIDA